MSPARAFLAGALAASALAVVACLPEDDTPQPGVATFVVRGSAASAVLPPFEDGWTVTITHARLLVIRGYQSNGLCDVYSETDFSSTLVNPLYDGDASLGRVRGLGICSSSLVPGGNVRHAQLGPGLGEEDRATLSAKGPWEEVGSGPSLVLEARAVRDDLERTVSLLVPSQGLFLTCPRPDGSTDYTLRSGEAQTLVATFDFARVFADSPLPGARLRLGPFLRADQMGNGDGHTTVDELEKVELQSFAQQGYDIAAISNLRPLTPLLSHWVAAMVARGFSLDGRPCVPNGFPELGGLGGLE